VKVVPDNARGRFWVESRSEPGHSHLVDLVANGGRGECGCDHWKFRCQPAIKEGKAMRCSHIDAVRDHIADLAGPMSFRDRQKVVNAVIRQWVEEEG
jgi:hypothetical protein